MKTLRLNFDDREFKKLQNSKEAEKILGNCENWEDYFLKLAKIRK
jgi:hypothetical protein